MMIIQAFKNNEFKLKEASNSELDDSWVKLRTIHEHTGNRIIRQIMTECIEVLAKEIQKRDVSLKTKFENFINGMKMFNYLKRKDKFDGLE